MSAQLESAERVNRLCPLGVQFWDVGARTGISDGLDVVCYPKGVAFSEVRGVPNRSGTFSFQNLAFLRKAENGTGDEMFWNSKIATEKVLFVIEVSDPRSRFLPLKFEVNLPHRGPFSLEFHGNVSPLSPLSISPQEVLSRINGPGSKVRMGTWPNSPLQANFCVPLFSAPSRGPIGGQAILYGEILTNLGMPCPWALVTISIEAPRRGPVYGIGLADEKGRVLIMFPYPEPVDLLPGSPYGAASLTDQVWEAQIQAFWEPRPVLSPLGKPEGKVRKKEIPELQTILGQAAAIIAPNNLLTTKTQIGFGRRENIKLTIQ
jgi:hypothetical protein